MKNLNKSCFICGISSCDGIILNGEKICKACEERMINTKVIDEDYAMYKNKVKEILFSKHVKE